jgi:hypothetical protein
MTIGSAWTETTPASVSKLNFMELVSGTGAELAALDKTKHRLVTCTSTGSGFILDHVYLFSTDGTTSLDITASLPHNHGSDTTGGFYIDILRDGNPSFVDLWLTKATDLYEASWASPVYWNKTVTSTGTVENFTDGTTGERAIRLRPNGTSGSGSTINYPHLKLDFTKESFFQTKLQIETTTSIALHTGINADDVTAADSNTVKYNAEVCTVTNNNWFLRSADGSSTSTSDSGIAMSANRVSIMVKHFPGSPLLQLHVDQAAAFEKSSNVPTTGETSDNNLIKHSVKNSTAADRPLKMYGCRVAYTTSSSWYHG